MPLNVKKMRALIKKKCRAIEKMLLEKNDAYGNSVSEPVAIFSDLSALERIKVRMDDKLSRLARGKNTHLVPEDTELDLIGYLILKSILGEAR